MTNDYAFYERVRDESGLDVAVEALQLAFELENRGLRLELDDEGKLHVTPSAKLTDEDRGHIRKWRDDLVVIVTPRPLASDRNG